MSNFYHSSTPRIDSLHSFDNEKDNCGMGALVNIHGKPSYSILDQALCSVANMTHRGAVDADMKTGDGSGILSQIPFPLFQEAAANLGTTVTDNSLLGVGVFFFPQNDSEAKAKIKALAESALTKRNISIIGWRKTPVNFNALGKLAQKTVPTIEHLLVLNETGCDQDSFERSLYLCRREVELGTKDISDFYIPTLSSYLISYKALAMPAALRAFYLDLQNPKFETAIALYHQRFSTNTFPAWPLGQPFRNMCHNGEINTVKGNRNWMASREELFESEIWGEDVKWLQHLLSSGESDSASLDHALELLMLSGREPEHAMCMLVPPAYIHDQDISNELKAFYDYLSSFSEPWDGPAGLVYTNGKKVCASLDRNGLRPSRFVLTDDGTLYIGSESGAVCFPEENIKKRGRLGPGEMMSIELGKGYIDFDKDIKESLARQKPYRQWIEENRLELSDFVSQEAQVSEIELEPVLRSRLQISQGVTAEDLDMVFPPMIKGSQEAVFSMGDDIPLAVLSTQPRLLFTYFKQLFAQVTNPPIDPIREWSVMSLQAALGSESNLLTETPEHAHVLNLKSALLFEHELESIKTLRNEGFVTQTIDATWSASKGALGLQERLEEIYTEVDSAINAGVNILILSDKAISATRIAIPSLMVTGAVHHHLNRSRKRMRASIIVETAEARDTHQLACLFGFGATAVCPYLGYATVRQLCSEDPKLSDIPADTGMANYRKALEKGLLKIMSKMGISVLNSYQGAQIFEVLGLGEEVIATCFTGTSSRIAGIGFAEIAEESIIRHKAAWEPVSDTALDLGDPGYNRYRKQGERHAITTEVIKNFHNYVKQGKAEDYDEYVKATLDSHPITIKDLLEFKTSTAIPIDEVESVESIRKRFTTAAMSMGALSPEAHETLAIAMNRIGGKSDSGEGGEDARRYTPYPNGDLARSHIKQVASGRFGVTAHYLVNCDEIEIKMAQGAKPGEGGQLPGHKVTGLIAKLRNTQPGIQLISPPPHHDIYSIEDLAQLIQDLKEINPSARVTVKLVSETGVGTVAAGVAKANADTILISGHDGGTAASPLSSTKHCGAPWELGLAEAQQTLLLNGLRNKVTLRTDGGLRNGKDVIIAAILGAEEYNFGTIAMIAMGCVYVRKCHLNNCPVGVATTDPKWRAKFKGTPEMVINFFNGVAGEARQTMAQLGIKSINELIGRTDLLQQKHVPDHPKANMVDLTTMLKDIVPDLAQALDQDVASITRYRTFERNEGVHKKAVDIQILQDIAKLTEAQDEINPLSRVMDYPPIKLNYDVVNTDRNLGTRLSGRVAEYYGVEGLPENSINLTFNGTAGQSLGTFLTHGVTITVKGEANDYVGKGMSGGHIIVKPADLAQFNPAENSIVGNTCLYGATGGHLWANGKAGERFGVRNSNATAVVEGIGDHGCEYMTNGRIVVLGLTGSNFGAGMSGGVAYVFDEDQHFVRRVNEEMVVPLAVKRDEDIDELKQLIIEHAKHTGSSKALAILDDWEYCLKRFVRVIPKEKAALEASEKQHENAINKA